MDFLILARVKEMSLKIKAKDTINKLDALCSYSMFMPDKIKDNFLNELSEIKNELIAINSLEQNNILNSVLNKTDSHKIERNTFNTTHNSKNTDLQEKNPTDYLLKQTLNKKQIRISNTGDLPTLTNDNIISYFMKVTDGLIPTLTEEGRLKIIDLSLPIEIYETLKIINDKDSIYKLYKEKNPNKNFIDFINPFYKLEIEKQLVFTKKEHHVENNGWIYLGDLLVEGNLISESDLNKATLRQKNKKNFSSKGIFLGESLMELQILTEDTLRDALKIQKWLSKLSENAFCMDLDNQISEDKSSNFMDSIVPVLSDKATLLLNNPESTNKYKILHVIDGISTFKQICEKYKDVFGNDNLKFLKFIFKIEEDGLIFYKKSDKSKKVEGRIKIGTLLLNLGLIKEEQLDKALKIITNSSAKKLFVGEALSLLNFINSQTLEECLKVQKSLNSILTKMFFENTYIDSIKDIFKKNFTYNLEQNKSQKAKLHYDPKINTIISFAVTGQISGYIYYIFQNSFIKELIQKSYHLNDIQYIDNKIILEIGKMITDSVLVNILDAGIFCEIDSSVICDNQINSLKAVSLFNLTGNYGNFSVGFDIC